MVVPAGVGHCNEGKSADLLIVGAYPDNTARRDLRRGNPAEHDEVVRNIAAVGAAGAAGLIRFPEYRQGAARCGIWAGRLLARPQIVVGAVIACHPARQLGMRVGAADRIDLLDARRIDGELHDQPIG